MQPDISVTGITLSQNQHAYATQKAKQDQRQQHLAFHLCDYRHQRGSFDRIVSAGMLEHVGMRHFDSYFTLLAAHISFAVRMGWYFNCNWPMITMPRR